jgi:Tol biopolymer transport system component
MFMQLAPGWRIYRVGLDASAPQPVALPLGDLVHPAVSRDGRLLAYINEGTDGGLYVLAIDSTQARKVYPDAHIDQLAWSPQGDQLVLALPWWGSGPGAGGLRVVTLADGTTRDIASDLSEPSWAPDGRTILAAEGQAPTSKRIAGIYSVTLGDTTARLVIAGAGARSPAWSPDGRHIALALGGWGAKVIYTAGPDGSDLKQLTSADSGGTVTDLKPVWAPDGARIAFQRDHVICVGRTCSERYDIYVVGLAGSGLRNLTEVAAWGGAAPTW